MLRGTWRSRDPDRRARPALQAPATGLVGRRPPIRRGHLAWPDVVTDDAVLADLSPPPRRCRPLLPPTTRALRPLARCFVPVDREHLAPSPRVVRREAFPPSHTRLRWPHASRVSPAVLASPPPATSCSTAPPVDASLRIRRARPPAPPPRGDPTSAWEALLRRAIDAACVHQIRSSGTAGMAPRPARLSAAHPSAALLADLARQFLGRSRDPAWTLSCAGRSLSPDLVRQLGAASARPAPIAPGSRRFWCLCGATPSDVDDDPSCQARLRVRPAGTFSHDRDRPRSNGVGDASRPAVLAPSTAECVPAPYPQTCLVLRILDAYETPWTQLCDRLIAEWTRSTRHPISPFGRALGHLRLARRSRRARGPSPSHSSATLELGKLLELAVECSSERGGHRPPTLCGGDWAGTTGSRAGARSTPADRGTPRSASGVIGC